MVEVVSFPKSKIEERCVKKYFQFFVKKLHKPMHATHVNLLASIQ